MAESQKITPECEPAKREKRVAGSSARRRNAVMFVVVVAVWLAADQAAKAYFNAFPVGEVIAGPIAGLFELTLMRNIGAAWSMFEGMAPVRVLVALAVCTFLVAYVFFIEPRSSRLTVFGAALVFAGGLGNAIDRVVFGYVVDFINLTFIDFPVFNIADIGVTCGAVLFVGALFFSMDSGGER